MKGVTKRERNGKVTWEVRKPEGGSKSFVTEQEAIDYKLGVIEATAPKHLTVGKLVQNYLDRPHDYIAATSKDTLKLMLGMTDRVDDIDGTWMVKWVEGMKAKQLSPNTIKNKVNQFKKVLDWYLMDSDKANPATKLPPHYSRYKDDRIVNQKRERRLLAGEYELARDCILGYRPMNQREHFYAKSPEDRVAFLMLFQLLVMTGFRLREAIYLKRKDVDFNAKVIRSMLADSGKKKHRRDVPITKELQQLLSHYMNTTTGSPDEPLLPFWSGLDSQTVLDSVGSSLSKRFSNLFKYCGMEDITAHDLRHEAISSWLEMRGDDGNWLYRQEEVMAISGHDSTAAFDRYRNFRVESLADRLHRQTA